MDLLGQSVCAFWSNVSFIIEIYLKLSCHFQLLPLLAKELAIRVVYLHICSEALCREWKLPAKLKLRWLASRWGLHTMSSTAPFNTKRSDPSFPSLFNGGKNYTVLSESYRRWQRWTLVAQRREWEPVVESESYMYLALDEGGDVFLSVKDGQCLE